MRGGPTGGGRRGLWGRKGKAHRQRRLDRLKDSADAAGGRR